MGTWHLHVGLGLFSGLGDGLVRLFELGVDASVDVDRRNWGTLCTDKEDAILTNLL